MTRVVSQHVAGDCKDPAAKGRLRPILVPPRVQLQERLLKQIVSRVRGLRRATQKVVNRLRVACVQFVKGLLAAGLIDAHPFLICSRVDGRMALAAPRNDILVNPHTKVGGFAAGLATPGHPGRGTLEFPR